MLVDERHAMSQELEMHEELTLALEVWAVDELLDNMTTAKVTLQ